MQWQLLAGLRFFLVWIILSEHINLFVDNHENNFLFSLRRFNAVSAVLSFLLISGYSIANSITLKPKGFYKRRFLKVYPLYFSSIVCSLIPFLFFNSKIKIPSQEIIQPNLWEVIGNLFFLQGWLVKPLQSNLPLWTLSIGVFCYLLAPLIIKFSKKILFFLFFLFSFLYLLFPYLYNIFFPNSDLPLYTVFKAGLPFLLLFWSWLLGFLCFCEINYKIKLLLIILGCSILFINQNHTGKAGIFTYLITSLFLIHSPDIKIPIFFTVVFSNLGNISYSLYLFHMPSFIFAYSLLGIKNPNLLALFALIASIVFSYAINTFSQLYLSRFFKLS